MKNLISSQLWEVAIHRVRRSFETVHGANKFNFGTKNDLGVEIIVEGKNKGDRYRVNNNIVTMVYRHIHSRLIQIFTDKVTYTGTGYLSKEYTSQYLDPITAEPLQGKTFFSDNFAPLYQKGPWVLTERSIITEPFQGKLGSNDKFTFSNLKRYD